MANKRQEQKKAHQIETVEDLPIALISAEEGFISSYLAQKLLELPLKIIFVASKEVEEIKHLEKNERFTQKTIEAGKNLRRESFPKLSYVFQIIKAREESEPARIRTSTEELLEIAKKSGAKFQLVKIVDAYDPALEESLHNWNDEADMRIAIVMHAYGPKMPLKGKWTLAEMLLSLHHQKRLLVKGEGLSPVYPIFATEVATALSKAMFSEGTRVETLFMGGGEEITGINLAYKLRETHLKETGELYEIEFTDDGSEEPASVLSRARVKARIRETQESLSWKPKVNMEEGLAKTLLWLRHRPKVSPKPKKTLPRTISKKVKVRSKKMLSKRTLLITVLAIIAMVLVAPIAFTVTAGSAVFVLAKATKDLRETKIENLASTSQTAQNLFTIARGQLQTIARIIPAEPLNKMATDLDDHLKVGQLLSQALYHSAKAAGQGLRMKDIVLSQSNEEIGEATSAVSGQLDSVYTNLAHIETIVKERRGVLQGILPTWVTKKINEDLEMLREIRSLIADASTFLEMTPGLLGKEGRQSYLVILQNSAELRPTGGFIGSYALLTFEKGRLLDVTVEDVYAADGQLKGHVEPPAEIKEYLGEAGWYLRDSNWDPDFPTAARQIEWFFEKETGIEVDGTIAVNLYVIKGILHALGPLEISDFEKTITADNLFETAEFYSEINFFPGSTQKKDFLVSLTKNIIFRLEEADPQELARIAGSLIRSLKRGQLLIAIHKPKIGQRLNRLGWDGSLKEVSCAREETNCMKTYIAIREANVGVNKANYYIQRKLDIRQTIGLDTIKSWLTVKFRNQSSTTSWPGGEYKNYMRVYTNQDNKVMKVMVNGRELRGDKLRVKAEHGRQSVGFLVTVPVQEELEVILILESKMIEFLEGKTPFSFLLQKQPGTGDDPLTLSLVFPEGSKITNANLPLRIDGSRAELSNNFEEDLDLQVEFENLE